MAKSKGLVLANLMDVLLFLQYNSLKEYIFFSSVFSLIHVNRRFTDCSRW